MRSLKQSEMRVALILISLVAGCQSQDYQQLLSLGSDFKDCGLFVNDVTCKICQSSYIFRSLMP